jgi:transposase-like protein
MTKRLIKWSSDAIFTDNISIEKAKPHYIADILMRHCPICHQPVVLRFYENRVVTWDGKTLLNPELEVICDDCNDYLGYLVHDEPLTSNCGLLFLDHFQRYLEETVQLPKEPRIIHCPFCKANADEIVDTGDPRGSGVTHDFLCTKCHHYFSDYHAERRNENV